ncbi:hypothetical protein POTOM_039212 [Populus tomentosa]|uniref:Uncharacterized protein n=1 Tax=Populus tomentosa TaxID=118781 RepID=A0A8X7YUW8_POPTO|nr:hypothetical protein POTOM_039212 [Populus tomentosa]
MLGMGNRQPNRLESLRISMKKAGDEVKGASLASDAFFVIAWNDTVEKVCEVSIGVVAEHGGSIRNKDTIECCNTEGLVDSAATVTTTPWFVPDGTKEKFDGNGSDAIGIKGHSSAPVDIGGHKSDAIDIDKDLVGDEKDIEIAAVMLVEAALKEPGLLTTQNDHNLLNGNNMAESFEK